MPAQTGWNLQGGATGPNQVSTVTFTWSLSTADPPYYSISITPMGSASCKSLPNSDQRSGNPYTFEFTASRGLCDRIFTLAQQLNFFRDKYRIAANANPVFVSRSLTYRSGANHNQITYTSTNDKRIDELTGLFERISVTANPRRMFESMLSQNPNGLDTQLRTLDQQRKDKKLIEFQILAPVVQQVAVD